MTAICGWSNVAKWFPWPYLWPGSLPGPPSFDSHATKVQNSRRKQAVRDRAPLTFHFSWSKIIRSLLLPSASPVSGGGSGGKGDFPPLTPLWPIERCSADNIVPQAQPQIETALLEPVNGHRNWSGTNDLAKGIIDLWRLFSLRCFRVEGEPPPEPTPFRPVFFPSVFRVEKDSTKIPLFFFGRGKKGWIFNPLDKVFGSFWKRKGWIRFIYLFIYLDFGVCGNYSILLLNLLFNYLLDLPIIVFCINIYIYVHSISWDRVAIITEYCKQMKCMWI